MSDELFDRALLGHQEILRVRERVRFEAQKRAERRKASLDATIDTIPSVIAELRGGSPGFDAYMAEAERVRVFVRTRDDGGIMLDGIALVAFGGACSQGDSEQFRRASLEMAPTILLVDGEGVQGIQIASRRPFGRRHHEFEAVRLSEFEGRRYHDLRRTLEALADPKLAMLMLFDYREPRVLV
jgi:hypothetical protein